MLKYSYSFKKVRKNNKDWDFKKLYIKIKNWVYKL